MGSDLVFDDGAEKNTFGRWLCSRSERNHLISVFEGVNVIVRLDKRLFEILDDMGACVTREMFLDAYAIRKMERERDPRLIRRRKFNQEVNDMMSEIYFED